MLTPTKTSIVLLQIMITNKHRLFH
jgi:hypothetical protein